MAINYTEVGWDTTKYVNPTNMNQMDYGIKAACDGVDELDTEMGTTDISSIGDGTVTGAISKVNSDLTAQTSTVGTNAYTSHNSVVANTIIKCGNMVYLNLMMNFDEGYYVPTNTPFATVPAGYRPKTDRFYGAMIQISGGSWYGYGITVNTSGQIKQGLTANCSAVCISIAYEI